MDATCGPDGGDACSVNMARIHLMAGDLVSAYRAAVPSAEAGDRESMELLVDICTRAGDEERAHHWRSRLAAQV